MIWLKIVEQICFFALFVAASIPLGSFIAKIYRTSGLADRDWLTRSEGALYRIIGVNGSEEMSWTKYCRALMWFNLVGIVAVYVLQRLQPLLPLNPVDLPAVSPDSAFNTAVSFASNTNWQGYGGESTMSYLTQVLGLTVQNFLSAATGIAVLIALSRGFTRKHSPTIGNFWSDITKAVLYLLLPLAFIMALFLVSQGVVQTFRTSVVAKYFHEVVNEDGAPVTEQIIAVGPVASQVAIKQLGTNGGGFFNANSAHPFENPSYATNLVECLSIILLGGALCLTFGRLISDLRQGVTLFVAMSIMFWMALLPCYFAELRRTPALSDSRIATEASELQSGGNLEGKEVRFGVSATALWATATTAASNGSVNGMHDSFTPLGGAVPMILMQLGEVVFGGVGSGLYGMIAFCLVTVFVAGLMVGRTPEYLGKKIGAYEMKLVSLVILIPPLLSLIGTALAVSFPSGRAAIVSPGAHGFSEALYAYSSMGNNNGSAFAGFGANVPLHNICGAIAMFLSRYWIIIPTLALAGALARKNVTPRSAGTLRTDTPLFVFLLIATVLLVGALNYVPALALGPIAEELTMNSQVNAH